MDLTKKERNAINTLNRLAKRWPSSLWLYSASGTLCVMRCREDGEVATTKFDGVDQDYVVTTINIPNDGGDW